MFLTLGPRWVGRDRYQHWYAIRGQLLPSTYLHLSGETVVSLAARLGATVLSDSRTFGDLLRTQATLGREPHQRQAAAQALASGWHDHPDTHPMLRQLATTDEHWAVRQAAAQALATGWHDDPALSHRE